MRLGLCTAQTPSRHTQEPKRQKHLHGLEMFQPDTKRRVETRNEHLITSNMSLFRVGVARAIHKVPDEIAPGNSLSGAQFNSGNFAPALHKFGP
jgi:hypothetical protein